MTEAPLLQCARCRTLVEQRSTLPPCSTCGGELHPAQHDDALAREVAALAADGLAASVHGTGLSDCWALVGRHNDREGTLWAARGGTPAQAVAAARARVERGERVHTPNVGAEELTRRGVLAQWASLEQPDDRVALRLWRDGRPALADPVFGTPIECVQTALRRLA